MKKQEFVEAFEKGIEEEFATEVRVGIQMPDLADLEYIHNGEDNFEAKLEYYKKAYNDNMELNTFNQIKIVSIQFFHYEGGFWAEIEDFE